MGTLVVQVVAVVDQMPCRVEVMVCFQDRFSSVMFVKDTMVLVLLLVQATMERAAVVAPVEMGQLVTYMLAVMAV
jgi:hypothetical protein